MQSEQKNKGIFAEISILLYYLNENIRLLYHWHRGHEKMRDLAISVTKINSRKIYLYSSLKYGDTFAALNVDYQTKPI